MRFQQGLRRLLTLSASGFLFASVWPGSVLAGSGLSQSGLAAPVLHGTVLAQNKDAPGAEGEQADEGGAVTPLAVGALQIASDAALLVEAVGIDVTPDRVGYVYRLKNTGAAAIGLSASVAMPDLELSADDDTSYDLPAPKPDNPVTLAVTSDGKPVATLVTMAAFALGLDQIAALQAEKIPLVPFDADKALAAATPETLGRLARLGLVSPRDPAHPEAAPVADWSLHVTHSWTQTIEAGKTVALAIGFAPIKATYAVDKEALAGFDALKDQICLTPRIVGALKTSLKTKTATFTVVDVILANDKPTRWTDSPAMTIAVHKPKPTSVVVFCGADAASAAQPIARGTIADDGANTGTRVMIFTPDAP